MDIETLKPTTSQNKQNIKSQIHQSKQKILKLKILIMQIVCATFYPAKHRCILSYIAESTLRKQQVKDEDLQIFQNHSSLLVDLKDGYFITNYQVLQQRKQGKRDKKITCYKLDDNRFFLLISDILKSLQVKLKKINEFYIETERQAKEGQQNKSYKRCKQCHTKQNIQIKSFGFDACEKCNKNDFEDVLIDQTEKTRIDKLNQIIMEVFAKLKQIRDLDSGLKNQIEINEQKKDLNKVSEIDYFMNPYVKYLKDRHQYIEIEANLKTIKETEKLQAPITEFQRVKDMIRSREARERTRQKVTLKHSGQQKIRF